LEKAMTQNTRNGLDRGLLLLRIALGIVFVMHGGQKLFTMGHAGVAGFLGSMGVPFPGLNAGLLIATELGGGLALLAGAGTRLVSVATAFAMLVAVWLVHLPNGFFLPNGYEFALLLLLGSLALTQTGAGAYSVDAWLGNRKSGELPTEYRLPRAA
jgi:putative oxidoreductase